MSSEQQNGDAITDDERFRRNACAIREITEAFLRRWWGERCPDTSPLCHCCDKWMLLDALLENPFDENTPARVTASGKWTTPDNSVDKQ